MKKQIYFWLILILFSYPIFTEAQNYAISFDGDNDYILCGENSAANITDNTMTLEAWIYPTAFDDAAYKNSIVGNDYWGNAGFVSEGYVFRFGGATGDLNFTFGYNHSTSWFSTTASGVLSLNKWQHVAAVYNGSSVKIYVNGIEKVSNNVSYTIEPSTINLYIGACAMNITERQMDGKIDEVRIWSDARTEDELRTNMYSELNGNEDGLVAYYKLNETSGTTAADATSNGADGTLTNMNGNEWFTSPAMFGPKNGLYFNSDDYVSIPSIFGLGTTSVTLECWVNLTSTSRKGAFIHIGNHDTGYGIGVGDGLWDNNGNELIVLYDLMRWIPSGTNLGTGWHHVALVINSSSDPTIYLDGVAVYSDSGLTDPLNPVTNSSIGSSQTSNRNLSDGTLDEVRIWNTARTAQQIRENMCKSLIGTETGLVAYYNCDNSLGSTLQDFTGNSYDGTLHNMSNSNWVSSSAFNTWLNTSSNDWYVDGNWSLGSRPTSSDNVHISNFSTLPTNMNGSWNWYDITVNQFVVPSTLSNFHVDVDEIRVSGNAFFYYPYTINTGDAVFVDGLFFANDTQKSLFTASNNSSLLTYGNVEGEIQVNKSISANNKWHLISMPNNSTTTTTFQDYYLQEWDEVTSNWVEISDLAVGMTPLKGYSLFDVSSKSDFVFTGVPNTGELSIPMTFHSSTIDTNGMNLVGNPYPSAIIASSIRDNYGYAYVWHPENGPNGSYVSYPSGDYTTISSLQGFFLYTETDKNFVLDDSYRCAYNSGFQKSAQAEQLFCLRTEVSAGKYDKLYIDFQEDAIPDFELLNDAFKIPSIGKGQPNLFSKYGQTRFSIDVRPETDFIQLGFINDQNGTYKIDAEHIDEIYSAFLEDTKLNQFHNLAQGAYSFDWVTTDSEERFILHLKATGTEEMEAQAAQVYAANGQVYIRMSELNSYSELAVYDLSGRLILDKTLADTSLQNVSLDAPFGAYLVQLRGEYGTKSFKIVL